MFEIETYATEQNAHTLVRPVGRPRKYPFGQLKVGQGFFVPDKSATDIRPTANRYGKEAGIKIICRDDMKGDGTHVIRVA